MSVPLGNVDSGLQDGVNFQVLPSHGNAASQLLQKGMIKEIGLNLAQHNSTTGNYKSLLAPKTVCNDIIVVFIGDQKSLVFSPVGLAFNVSYAHYIKTKRLYDQVNLII